MLKIIKPILLFPSKFLALYSQYLIITYTLKLRIRHKNWLAVFWWVIALFLSEMKRNNCANGLRGEVWLTTRWDCYWVFREQVLVLLRRVCWFFAEARNWFVWESWSEWTLPIVFIMMLSVWWIVSRIFPTSRIAVISSLAMMVPATSVSISWSWSRSSAHIW